MGHGAYAELLNGDCIRKNSRAGNYGSTNIVFPYRQISLYTFIGTVGGNNQTASTCACGINTDAEGSPVTDKTGTQALPVVSLPSTTYSRGIRYGRHPANTVSLDGEAITFNMRSNGDAVYFKSSELEPWRQRSKFFPHIIGDTGYKSFASGPPLKHGIVCMSLRRRLKRKEPTNNRDYAGRMAFDFQDADEPIYGQTDWMGPVHPAGYFWTNEDTPEPFLVRDYYEQGGASPATATDPAFKGIIPFCNPMPVYSQNGTQVGSYVGYAMQHYFSMGFIHFAEATNYVPNPNKPGDYTEKTVFLPDDYRSPINPVTGKHTMQVKLREQFFSLSTNLYMVGDNGSLGSPKVASARFWWYNDGLYTNEPWINKPYLCGFISPQMYQSAWQFPLEFRVLNAAPERVALSLEPMSTYLTA